MNFRTLLSIAVLLFITTPIFASDTVYHVSGDRVKERLCELIEYARQSIDVCIRDFASLGIDEHLEAAKDRGVRVRVVILEQDINHVRGSLAEALFQKDFDTRVLNLQHGFEQMQDFIISDDRVTVTGPYNWLAYQDRCMSNDVLFDYRAEKMQVHKSTFCRLFTEGIDTRFVTNLREHSTKGSSGKSDTVFVSTESKQAGKVTKEDRDRKASMGISSPAQEAITRDFIDISLTELDKQFGKESTLSRSEKNSLWKKYQGKYVRWYGVVAYKGMGRVDWNRVGVKHPNEKDLVTEITFDWKMFDKVLDLKEGSSIIYTGRLLSRPIFSAPYRLEDGNIEFQKNHRNR